MADNAANNKRIAKNTLMLYVRMLIMMAIGLYTSRVILNALGISDLGLLNVAGGVVAMFGFMTGTLSSGTQRFLSFELGSGNMTQLKKTFQTALTLHALLAIAIVILSETIGLWYVYNKLNIEPGRFNAALWCFQLSVLAAVAAIIQVPFSASLIAHEKMDIYAYMSIYDAAVKLLGAFLIQLAPWDRVIFYSTLTFAFGITSILIYNWYCRHKFEECRFKFGYDKAIFNKMLGFSGWNTIGCLAATGQSTGVNLVINFFCGTAVNGARGIAFQASSWVMRFVDNFQTALNPQIVKDYAANDKARMNTLVIQGAKYSSYLLLLLGIPLFIEIELVIRLWLGECPEYVPVFLRIILIEALFRTIGNPTITAMHATGEMKILNITVGSVLLLILPISIFLFRIGCSVEVVTAVNVLPWVIVIPIRLLLLRKYCGFPVWPFMKEALIKTIALAVIMFLPPYALSRIIKLSEYKEAALIIVTSIFFSALVIWFVGLRSSDRKKVKAYISRKLRRDDKN